jgi:hypothetical protein
MRARGEEGSDKDVVAMREGRGLRVIEGSEDRVARGLRRKTKEREKKHGASPDHGTRERPPRFFLVARQAQSSALYPRCR